LPAAWQSPLGLLGGARTAGPVAVEDAITLVPLTSQPSLAPALGAAGWAAVAYLAIAAALLGGWIHLGGDALASCIADFVRGLRFPAPAGGPVEVEIPFFFQGGP
jgi:hypothetical protein